MRQWDILLFPFREELPHPAVIISNDERCENADLEVVNALICTSAQLNRPPKKNEIILDESDGLGWKTAVRCDVIYLLPKAEFAGHRGQVNPLRRALIARKIAECLRLPASW